MRLILKLTFISLLFFCLSFISFSQELTLGLPLGHSGPTSFNFSVDSKFIISSSIDGAKLWESSSGNLLNSLDKNSYINTAELSSDITNPYAITVNTKKRSIKLWQLNTGELLGEFRGTKSKFSPDGKFLATFSKYDFKTKFLDTSTLNLKFEIEGYFLGFGNSETLFIKNNDYKVYDLVTGKLKYIIDQQSDPIQSVKILKDGEYFLTISKNNVIGLRSVTNGNLEYTIDQQSDPIQSIQFLKGGEVFLTISKKNVIRLHKVSNGKLINSYHLDEEVENVVLDDNAELFAVNYSNGDSQLFTTRKRKKISKPFQQSKTLAILKNSKKEGVIIQNENESIIGYNLNTKKTMYSIPGFYYGECGFVISPNHKYFLVTDCTSTNEYSASIGANKGFVMFDVYNGKYIHSFFSSANKLRNATISKNLKYLSNVSHTAKSQIFNLRTGKIEHILDTQYAISSKFSSDSKYLETSSDMRALDLGSDMGHEILIHDSQWIWDVSSGSLISVIDKYENSYLYPNRELKFDINVSNDNSKTAIIWKVEDGLANPHKELIGHSDQIIYKSLSQDKKIAVTASQDKTVKLWDTNTGKLLNNLTGYNSKVTYSQFNKDNQNLLTSSEDGTQKVWDFPNEKLLHSFQFENKKKIIEEGISNGTYKIIHDLENDVLKVFNLSNDELIHILNDHKGIITSFQFISNTNFMISSSYDGSIIFWDVKTGKQLVRQFVFDSKDPLWLLPNGYYSGTKEAASKLYYIKGLQTIGFEQLDVKYNRPDKVLEVLGGITGAKNTTMIKAYKKAWQKRIKKLEIDTTSFKQGFSIPESDFTNREAITYEQNNSELKLHIKALDSTYLLDRFNIWINEVPVYGNKGISVRHKKAHRVDTTLTVKLSNGSNKIETSVLNINGIESYRLPLYVNHTPKEDIKEKLYFVGIGIDRYQEVGHDLNYSVKDIKDLAVQLKEKYGNQIEIDTLFNQSVTIKNILELKERLKTSKVDDKVIISFSGHGLLSEDLDYYLATYDVNFDSPEQNGLPYEDLEYLLDGIPSRQKLLLIDACHSGEVDKDEVEAIAQVEKQKEGLKGSIVVKSKKTKMGMKNSFELMKELFNNVDRATGATVISAAAGTQFAQERGNLKNGVFTYCILNQLKEKATITVSELKLLVSAQVQEITNGLQQPTSRNETIENDWKIW